MFGKFTWMKDPQMIKPTKCNRKYIFHNVHIRTSKGDKRNSQEIILFWLSD